MDYSMPECDGPTATIAIREIFNRQGYMNDQQSFIACLSAYQEKRFKDVALMSGMDCFLTKPMFKEHLHKLLIKTELIK